MLGADREVEEETRRFWAVLRQAREEAELQAIDVAIFVGANDYEFLRFDTRRNEWQPIVDDQLYAQRSLPEGLRFRLWMEGREIVLKPGLPDRSKKDEIRNTRRSSQSCRAATSYRSSCTSSAMARRPCGA